MVMASKTQWLNERSTPANIIQLGIAPRAAADAPYNENAELAVISCVLYESAMSSFVWYQRVSEFLKPEDFFLVRNGYIWRAIERVMEREGKFDYILLVNELAELKILDEVGGEAYIIGFTTRDVVTDHALIYGGLVRRASIRRAMMVASDKIHKLSTDGGLTLEQAGQEMQAQMDDILFHIDRLTNSSITPIREAVAKHFDRVDYAMNNGAVEGVPTGFRDLDEILRGLKRSKLYLLGGRPGMGKTALACTLALNNARYGARVVFVSLEMTEDEITNRLLANEAAIDTRDLEDGKLNPQEYSRYVEAAGRVAALPLTIIDERNLSPSQLRSKLIRIHRESGIDVIYIDYIDVDKMNAAKANGDKEKEARRQMDMLIQAVSDLTDELNIPIVVLAQLNRGLEHRQDKRPVLSDLKESGKLESEADVVMFVYRDVVYNTASEFPNQADIIIAKHRNGPTGTISLYFDKHITKFTDAAIRRVDLQDDKVSSYSGGLRDGTSDREDE